MVYIGGGQDVSREDDFEFLQKACAKMLAQKKEQACPIGLLDPKPGH